MNHPEAKIQREIAGYLSWALPDTAWFTAIAHGVRHGDGNAAWLRGVLSKQMGTQPGVPDLIICYDANAYFLEIKSAAGSVSKAQRYTHSAIRDARCPVAVVRSLADTKTILAEWGIPVRVEKPAIEASRRAFMGDIELTSGRIVAAEDLWPETDLGQRRRGMKDGPSG